jgi:predicted RNase H-like HicB family nuclease
MMDRYVAVLRKTPSSDFGVEFLDLPGCFSAGSTLEEAKSMAAEALRLHLDGLHEDGVEVPGPSDLDAIERKLRGKRGEDFYALVEVEAEPEESKVVRVNITIEERLLREIDTAASEGGMSRSGFLADAARRSIRRSVRPAGSKSPARRR